MQKSNRFNKKRSPIIIRIISAVLFLSAAWLLFGVIVSIHPILKGGLQDIIEQESPSRAEEFKLRFENRGLEYNEGTLSLFLILGLAIMFCIAGFLIWLGVSLWKMKNWARMTVIVLAFIYSFINLFGLLVAFDLFNILVIAVSLAIGIYLLMNNKVRRAFKKDE